MNTDLDYVGYAQDLHHASREFLFGLQEDNIFIDVYRFFHPYDLSYTWKIHNTQQPSRIDFALANQNLIRGVTGMKHTWNQCKYSDHVMVTVVVDFESIEKSYGIFKCPSEQLHHDVDYQAIIKSMITKCLLEEQQESETRMDLLNIIHMKINEEYTVASLRQTPGKDGFENTERLLLSNIAILD